MSQRRQYSSCDPCRRSKRRCSFSSSRDGEKCTICRRLGHSCTFDFAKSRKARLRQNQSHSPQSINRDRLPEIAADGLSNSSDGHVQAGSMALGDVLTPWVNFTEDCRIEEIYDDTLGLDLTDLLASDAATPAQVPSEARLSVLCSPLDRLQRTIPFLAGGSLNSPIRLLNSKLDATVLDDRLARIHDVIITGCASRFADYDCNIYATASRYRLEGGDAGPSQESTPTPLELGTPLNNVLCTLTAIGAVRFLDHFSALYDNRLSPTARKQSDVALKTVLRAFSLQWLSTESTSAADTILEDGIIGIHTTCDGSRNAFYDSWFQARASLSNAQSVGSFRVVYAILLFDGIVVPTKASAESAHEFLDIGLERLCSLDTLVRQYCTTLGADSIYSGLLEASLNVVRWGGYIRDVGASLTTDRRCRLPAISGHDKVPFSTGSTFEWPNDQDLPPDLDDSIPGICQKAVAEAFCVWRRIADVKNSMHSGLPSVCIEAIASTVAAVSRFNQLFCPFINHCIQNLECLSIHSRTASVSIALFWDLSVLILAETLEFSTRESDLIDDSTITSVRTYQEEAVSSVTRTVERVLSLPTEDIFNVENGLGAEVPLIAYHITPSLTAAVFQKTIETLIYSQTSPFCIGNSLQMDPTANRVWQRQIDIVMKGLSFLGVTVGGSEAATSVFQSLMPRHGDVLSECWTSDFST